MSGCATPLPFGGELRRLRVQRGVSLAGLSRLVHYSKGYLSKIENGDKPVTLDVARRCDAALGAGGSLVALVDVLPRPRHSDTLMPLAEDCPYRGLAPYDLPDARWFFGRERATATLVARLADRVGRGGPLVVVGDSGAGKSSLLRAGLLPALARGSLPAPGSTDWPVLLCTPTESPVTELAAQVAEATGSTMDDVLAELAAGPQRLVPVLRDRPDGPAPSGSRLVLVVDQFEETFALCADEDERRLFVQALCAAAGAGISRHDDPPALVVLAVRADYYGHCLAHPALLPALQQTQFALGPMSTAELRSAIVEPARVAGLELEPGLVELLLADLGVRERGNGAGQDGYDPAALPLLSHALLATWQRRDGRRMPIAAYRATGGVGGALAGTAEEVYGALAPSARPLAREMLLGLVAAPDHRPAIRRRLTRGQLGERFGQRDDAACVLDAFGAAGLLTVRDDGVRFAHDAVLRGWPRLREWVEEDRTERQVRHRLRRAAAAWDGAGRDPALLDDGARLAAAAEWTTDDRLDPRERAFLHASLEREQERQRTLRNTERRWRRVVVALAVMLVLALVVGAVALRHRQQALDQRRLALSGELAAEASMLSGQPDAAMLLAVEAFRQAPTREARGALLSTQARLFTGRLTGHQGPVYGAAFSPDGGLLATASADRTVRLWDVVQRRQVGTLAGHTDTVVGVAFSPSGNLLATVGTDHTVRLWEVASRRQVDNLPGAASRLTGVAFSPDGRLLAVSGEDRTVRLWDMTTHRQVGTLAGHTDAVEAVAWSPDGRTLASAGADRTIRLWDVAARSESASLIGHAAAVYTVAWSPDGRSLASGGEDGVLRLWNVADRRETARMTGHTGRVWSVVFSPDGTTLATAGDDQTARLWDVASRHELATLAGHTSAVHVASFAPDGTLVATTSSDGSTALWDVRASMLVAHPSSAVLGAVFLPGDRGLATAGEDGALRLWNVTDRRQVAVLGEHAGPVRAVAASGDGRLLATAGDDGTARLWDVANRRELATLTGHTGPVYAVAFSPDGRLLATAGDDGSARLWDVANRRELASLTGHTGPVYAVAWSPDGASLATGGQDDTVRLWDVESRRERHTLGRPGAVRAVAWSPDGDLLASAGDDRAITLWDMANQHRLATLIGHSAPVYAMAFSPDGTLLATGGADRTANLWRINRHREPATLTGHTAAIRAVAFDSTGTMLATASEDDTVHLWDPSPERVTRWACHILGRPDRARWDQLLPDVPYQPTCG
jgi:WD40 repeat protein/transcriptional regulator with XRE-family HTH domain